MFLLVLEKKRLIYLNKKEERKHLQTVTNLTGHNDVISQQRVSYCFLNEWEKKLWFVIKLTEWFVAYTHKQTKLLLFFLVMN